METSLLGETSIDVSPEDYLKAHGSIFARFDERTQDSGNVSYGVEADGRRFFVKTAGALDAEAFLPHTSRVHWLRNAVQFNKRFNHIMLPRLHNVIESPHGPMLIYDWVDGEPLGVPRDRRQDPESSFARFRSLPLVIIFAALDQVFKFHESVCARGWIANDFYDGAMIYDFDAELLHLVDLDNYRDGPFVNDMGSMFGSTRFMAPEEFEHRAKISETTTVFTMGQGNLDNIKDLREALAGQEYVVSALGARDRSKPDNLVSG